MTERRAERPDYDVALADNHIGFPLAVVAEVQRSESADAVQSDVDAAGRDQKPLASIRKVLPVLLQQRREAQLEIPAEAQPSVALAELGQIADVELR